MGAKDSSTLTCEQEDEPFRTRAETLEEQSHKIAGGARGGGGASKRHCGFLPLME